MFTTSDFTGTTSAIAPYLKAKILEHVLQNTSFSASYAWLGLYKGNPQMGGGEVSGSSGGTNYSRKQVSFTISGSTASNTSQVVFDKPTTTWGIVTNYALMDSQTNGNMLFYGAFSLPKTVYSGNTFFVNPSELKIEISGAYSSYLANKILGHTLNNTSYTSPGLNVFAALYTTVPNVNDSGGTEVNASNYERLRISGSGWESPNFIQTGINPPVMLRNSISLPFCSDSQYTWGSIQGLCLRDSSTAGNQLFRGYFYQPIRILLQDSFTIQIGNLSVSNY